MGSAALKSGYGNRLARHMAFSYAVLVIYASLHPFAGWTISGAPLFDFLGAPWPRYFTLTDLALNVLAYLPLGMLLVPAQPPRVKPGAAVVLAVVAGTALSFSLETLQNYLPSRVPSNVDLASNGIGTLLGALLGVRFGRLFADGGGLSDWRRRRIVHGALGDAGLVLIVLWLATQLNPEILLFGNGDLRALLGLPAPLMFTAQRHIVVEQAVSAAGTVAAGLIFWQLMRQRSLWLLGALFVLAFLVKSLAAVTLMQSHEAGQWITPGNTLGFATGAALLAVGLLLPARLQTTLAALALLAGTALVNLAPVNPYIAEALAGWHQGHFLNFNGLTRLASMLWPFLALALLLTLDPLRGGQGRSPPSG